jgi:amino acid transporter
VIPLGLTIVIGGQYFSCIGGQYFSWNLGLDAGFGTYLICMVLMGTSYTILCVSISEVSSCLPFAGGAYGLARCTLGFYPGFLIGFCDILESIAYVSASALSLGYMINEIIEPDISPFIIWFLFFATALFIQLVGGNLFWNFNMLMAISSLLILLMYCFGSLPYVSFNTYATEGVLFGDGVKFIHNLPLAAWFFVGVESLTLACSDVADPQRHVPTGQILCVITLFITATLTMFISCSSSPGTEGLVDELNPLNFNFMRMFVISNRAATILSVPSVYATAFGFMWSYGKLLVAMADSHLIPSLFKIRHSKTGKPYVALILGSIAGYLLCAMVYFVPSVEPFLFNLSILAAFCAYMSQCYGFIELRTKYRNINRLFYSPFGIAGAVYAMCVWAMGIISILGFQNDNFFTLIVAAIIIILLTIYYFAVAVHVQTFSEEEKKILFKTHLVNSKLVFL